MAKIVSKHPSTNRWQLVHSPSAPGFDEGQQLLSLKGRLEPSDELAAKHAPEQPESPFSGFELLQAIRQKQRREFSTISIEIGPAVGREEYRI